MGHQQQSKILNPYVVNFPSDVGVGQKIHCTEIVPQPRRKDRPFVALRFGRGYNERITMYYETFNWGLEPSALQSLCEERATELVCAAELTGGLPQKRRTIAAIEDVCSGRAATGYASRVLTELYARLCEPEPIPQHIQDALNRAGNAEEVATGMACLKNLLRDALEMKGLLPMHPSES